MYTNVLPEILMKKTGWVAYVLTAQLNGIK